MRAAVVTLGSMILSCVVLVGGVGAQNAPVHQTDPLLDLLGLEQTVDIMRDEGVAYAMELAEEMLPAGPTEFWKSKVEAIYDKNRMAEVVRAGFAESYGAQDLETDTLEAFFGSEFGRGIVQLEVSAREAMSDDAIEEVARETYTDRATTPDEVDSRLALIRKFVEANDLIEANVVGGLNSTIRFYQGLVDGGALEMTEEDILREVWGSEDDTRMDTIEWLHGFLLMAYRPLSDDELTQYSEVYASREGRAMNRALFVGFDVMYADISYALGRAIADQMNVQEL